MLLAEKVGRIGHIADRVEEFDAVRVVRYDQWPVGMTVADDLEMEVMFGLAMAVAWMERHCGIRDSDDWSISICCDHNHCDFGNIPDLGLTSCGSRELSSQSRSGEEINYISISIE